ncbi:hypothetical protein BU25DRAFT_413343 [Macroventuria anomochaeta]|uniref:Uncharacterized protein n=1 Tax=Macroventuria anomochaeta TaxID=301207 RepID=A0ACB6RV35_9PLEO|nr:uncharacterized protein BU25DRAFT_413343 [Macroventuria anomochaeta]KAF2624804.1 hypothetical protein BU25DRAFT_413343 [Macroventuria anomochaeta]
MASAKASLDTLPEELILTIMDFLDDIQPLLALNATTHRLHRLTLSRLYNRFPGRNSELFLRTISHSPQLAKYTKSTVWHQERKTVPRIDMLEKRHVVTRLNQLAVPHGTDLAEQFAKFGKSDDYWYMEVLLLFMPNLESVEVRESWLWDDHHYWFKSASPFFNPLCESRLKSATLYGPLRIENVVPLLTIPSLRRLKCSQVVVMRREGFKVFQWGVWPVERVLPEGASNLEHLALEESCIDLENLMPIMSGIKALKSFAYEHMPNDLADEASRVDHINSAALSSCLKTQRASLEYIRIRDTQQHEWSMTNFLFGPNANGEGGRNDRTDFPNLHTLDIGPLFSERFEHKSSLEEEVRALATESLPSLKTIRFMIDANFFTNIALENFLRAFAHTLASERPGMEVVELVGWDPMLGWFPDNLPALQEVYAHSGLRLGSVCGDILDIHGAEPLLINEDTEPDWVVVTDLRLSSRD